MSGTSMSVTGTAAGGSSEWVSQKVEFVKSEIPETMNKAFRIIERLLT
jgi:ribulose kinase